MTEDDALALIGAAGLDGTTPASWADLGCGDGTFTLALAALLPAQSVIHAVDRNAPALRKMPREYSAVSIVPHVGDFLTMPWPFDRLDGLLLANSLHFVRDPMAFIRACALALNRRHRFLIVEYDTDRPNRWVPYPLSRTALEKLFNAAGYSSIVFLGSRPSAYQRAGLYSAMVEGS